MQGMHPGYMPPTGYPPNDQFRPPVGPEGPMGQPRVAYHYYAQNSNQNVIYPENQMGGYQDPNADRKPGFNPMFKKVHRRAKLRKYLLKKKQSQKKNPKNGPGSKDEDDQ